MACDLTTIQEAACESEIGRLSNPIKLLQVIAQLSCDLSESGVAGNATVGSGSPQGVVTGNPGKLYVDITNHAFWIKETGTTNTGWVQYV